MAKAAAYEDSDEEQPTTNRGGASRKESTSVKAAQEVLDVDKDDEQEDDGDENEEEFEIEAILAHKKDVVKKGHMAYYVKWKGYDDTENSWIDEEDAGGAQEIINEYNEKLKKKNSQAASRKRTSTATAGKKSITSRDEGEESTPASTSKRGRGGRAAGPMSDGSEDEEVPKSKASAPSKKGRGSPVSKKRKIDDMDEDSISPEAYLDFADRMEESSWEHLVKAIDTVERSSKGLIVYFRTTDGKMVRQPSNICAKKFPQKLIEFYETNLKWRDSTGRVV